MPEYDDTNRGAMFTDGKQSFTGKANFAGVDYYAIFIATGNQNEKAPSHKLILEQKDAAQDAINGYVIPLWRDDPDKPSLCSGKFDGHFVNVYLNDKDGKKYISVQFKEMQQRAATAPAAGASDDNLV